MYDISLEMYLNIIFSSKPSLIFTNYVFTSDLIFFKQKGQVIVTK